jgi:hypothetical protein
MPFPLTFLAEKELACPTYQNPSLVNYLDFYIISQSGAKPKLRKGSRTL